MGSITEILNISRQFAYMYIFNYHCYLELSVFVTFIGVVYMSQGNNRYLINIIKQIQINRYFIIMPGFIKKNLIILISRRN